MSPPFVLPPPLFPRPVEITRSQRCWYFRPLDPAEFFRRRVKPTTSSLVISDLSFADEVPDGLLALLSDLGEPDSMAAF